MRLNSIFTAILVCAAVYLFIVERDALLAFAGVEAEAEETVETVEDTSGVPVQVLKSELSTFETGILLRGRTEAFRNVNVSAEISGSVISQPLRRGALVSEGDLLCQLDPGTLEAALTEAKARLAEAEANNNVSSSLVERGFASQTTVISREAALESAQAAVKRAQEDLERLSIRAPFDGILESDTAELGSLLQPGAPCANIISLNPIKLVGFATEEQIPQLKIGSMAGARLITGERLVGELTFLARSADPATRTYRVEVTVPNEDLSVRDGATAEIVIQLPGIAGHFLPQSSLTLDDSGKLGVRLVEDNKAQFYPVSILGEENGGIWVTGLPETSDVIVVGQEYVTDGVAVVPSFVEEGS